MRRVLSEGEHRKYLNDQLEGVDEVKTPSDRRDLIKGMRPFVEEMLKVALESGHVDLFDEYKDKFEERGFHFDLKNKKAD